MKPAIRVQGLSKQYRLGGSSAESYQTLREAIVSRIAGPWRRARRLIRQTSPSTNVSPTPSALFSALRDVSFDVRPGEVVGLVGRNGAGKSTLLKVISRITEPTAGRVELRGRVASLLEVGTGFHPELSGRENIYLNGAVLGMSRVEIARKFDAIVQFAEMETFLDTPVKRYSSGMYVRLAFAVAAHLEPEILLVDEVLAVGDIAFQRKCLGRMREVSRSGRTVLFVSHNMAAIEALCDSAVLMNSGAVAQMGAVQPIVKKYYRLLQGQQSNSAADLSDVDGPDRNEKVLQSAVVVDDSGNPTTVVPMGGELRIKLRLYSRQAIEDPSIGMGIDDQNEQRILTVHTPLSRIAIERIAGNCEVNCVIPALPLAPDDYWIKIAVAARGKQVDCVEKALGFTVVNADAFGEGRGFHRGLCVAASKWSIRMID